MRIIAIILLLAGGTVAAATAGTAVEGRWAGTLTYRAAPLELAVDFGADPTDGRQALLDIPSLVYARQAVEVTQEKPGVVALELPFGIGTIPLRLGADGMLHGEARGFALRLAQRPAVPVQVFELAFGAFEPALEGTLRLPPGPGPHPVVVLIAGAGNASRESWSYASWTEFYLGQGIGAFIYDRRGDLAELPDGRVAGIEDHARDVADAIRRLRDMDGVDAKRIGLSGGSRGAWIAMAANRLVEDLAFFNFHSVSPLTPGEQEIISVLTGMQDDGLSAASLDAARAYLRLYFYVAQTGRGWDLLAGEMASAGDSDWFQYVDQPRSLDDLRWWRANMNFDTASQLAAIRAPVRASWGGKDFITPWAQNRSLFERILNEAGNDDVTTAVYPGADHRLEVDFGEDADGQWHWFGMAPGLLDELAAWLQARLEAPGEVRPKTADQAP